MPPMSIRVYADTSVFGGVFDEEFSAPSRAFFDEVRSGRFQLVVSPVIELENRRIRRDSDSHTAGGDRL